MKKSKNIGSFLFLILINTLSTTIACFTNRKVSSVAMTMTTTPENYVNRTTRNITLIEISSTKTCNNTIEPNKELFICYHNGVCKTKLVPLNFSHYDRKVYCLCEKYFNGENCKEDDSFIIGDGNVLIIAIIIIICFGAICYVICKACSHTKQQHETSDAVRPKKNIYSTEKSTSSKTNDDADNENLLNGNSPPEINTSKKPLDRSLSAKTGELIDGLNRTRENTAISQIKEGPKRAENLPSKIKEKKVVPETKSSTKQPLANPKARLSTARGVRTTRLEKKQSDPDAQNDALNNLGDN